MNFFSAIHLESSNITGQKSQFRFYSFPYKSAISSQEIQAKKNSETQNTNLFTLKIENYFNLSKQLQILLFLCLNSFLEKLGNFR